METSLNLEKLSDEQKRERVEILSKLHDAPASSSLDAYFQRLEEGSPTWDIDVFVEGIKLMASLSGPEKRKYYDNSLKGLHFPTTFTKLWNKAYPKLPITLRDQDIRWQCPPSWSNELKDSRHVITYLGEAPLSQGLNELLKGPTTLDCGMFCQLVLWMAIRYLIGDRFFDEIYKFEKGHFVITQNWDVPINGTRTIGNLLYPFYDAPDEVKAGSLARIRTRTIFNHTYYRYKHPGGMDSLQNVTQIDGYNVIFDPDGNQTVLSTPQLNGMLRDAYNAPHDSIDKEKIWLYTTFPDYVHPDFAPLNYGVLAKAVERLAGHTVGENEWKNSEDERKELARGMDLVFNFQRLLSCLERTEADVNSILSRA
uniref:Uncharacterized protein n=1 Tax=Talaromyces marneffei PM1 TaxID=1077442 RepID=A0A093UM96_TALMA